MDNDSSENVSESVETKKIVPSYSAQAVERVKEFLDKREWRYEWLEERGFFKFTMGIQSKMKQVAMTVHVNKNAIAAFGHSPLNVDDKKLGRVGEYITRANYGLLLGNFEMDLRDGEVRFRSSIHFHEDAPPVDVVGATITLPLHMWGRYGDGFVAVLMTDFSPAEAIQKAEAGE